MVNAHAGDPGLPCRAIGPRDAPATTDPASAVGTSVKVDADGSIDAACP